MRKPVQKVVLGLCLTASSLAYGGTYSDELSRCLVQSSTPADRTVLAKWMFTSMALHPDVASMSTVTPQQRDQANKEAADMYTKLMTETCLSQARTAIQYEGVAAIQQGFTVFGQVAGQELFTNPSVAQSLSGLEKHLDKGKIATLLGLTQ